MRVKITWIERDGGRAAGLGLDERNVESVGTVEDARAAALEYAAEQGVDLGRYDAIVEPIADE